MAEENDYSSHRPRTTSELIRFYYEQYRPLYAYVQTLNQPPIEMSLEVSAAFDHLTRIEQFGELEEKAVEAASAHLKRACFDGYKLVVKKTCDEYNELIEIDLDDIDCGKFKQELIRLWASIRKGAVEARACEGNARNHSTFDCWHDAFDMWFVVYQDCLVLTKEFYESEKVAWAKHLQRKRKWKERLLDWPIGFIIGVLSGLLVAFLVYLFSPK